MLCKVKMENKWVSFKNLIILSLSQNDINWVLNLQNAFVNANKCVLCKLRKKQMPVSHTKFLSDIVRAILFQRRSLGRWYYNSNKMK